MTINIDPERDALFIADPQKCFLPGGPLPTPKGDEIFRVVNPLTKKFKLVIASQDWHPPHHVSFSERGGPWVPHCVQGTENAEFSPKFDQSNVRLVVHKAFNPNEEEYSAFDEQTKLAPMLKAIGIERVFMGGIATDYCVHDSAIGALKGGLDVYVIIDAIRGINVRPGDVERALDDMKEHGAKLISHEDIEGEDVVGKGIEAA